MCYMHKIYLLLKNFSFRVVLSQNNMTVYIYKHKQIVLMTISHFSIKLGKQFNSSPLNFIPIMHGSAGLGGPDDLKPKAVYDCIWSVSR